MIWGDSMRSLGELYQRRGICNVFIEILRNTNDVRAPAMLEKYRGQLATIDAEIAAVEQANRRDLGIPDPEPIVVGVKSVSISGKTKE